MSQRGASGGVKSANATKATHESNLRSSHVGRKSGLNANVVKRSRRFKPCACHNNQVGNVLRRAIAARQRLLNGARGQRWRVLRKTFHALGCCQ